MQTPFSDIVATALAYLSEIDPVMQTTIELVGPCTLQPDPDIFNALVDAIISQQISVKAADAIMARVRSALPEGKVTPENLLSLDFDRLRALGLSTAKARYIHNLVEHVYSGQLQLELLSELDDEEIIRQLTAVKGIGRWTAEMFLIFNLSRPDVLPLDDLGLIRAISINYFSGEPVTRSEAREVAANWEPWRTVATWYMWRSLDPVPVEY